MSEKSDSNKHLFENKLQNFVVEHRDARAQLIVFLIPGL